MAIHNVPQCSFKCIKPIVLFGRNFSQSLNSDAWMKRHVNDEYVKRARYENFRARSAFKLIEINEKYSLIKPGYVVIDLGASPGSWTQVATRLMGLNNDHSSIKLTKVDPKVVRQGFVISIDLLPISSIEGAITLGGVDFTNPLNQSRIFNVLNDRKVELVMSDMAPNATGNQCLDHEHIVNLDIAALQFATQVLKPKTGSFLCKLWDGERTSYLHKQLLTKFFKEVHVIKPNASRDHSAELFLLGQYFKGIKS